MNKVQCPDCEAVFEEAYGEFCPECGSNECHIELEEVSMPFQAMFTVGDRWDDGHGKYESALVNMTRKPSFVMQKVAIVRKRFSIPDFCSDYGDTEVPERLIELFKENGLEYSKYVHQWDGNYQVEDYESFINITLLMAKIILGEDLQWAFEQEPQVEEFEIGGYGLFH